MYFLIIFLSKLPFFATLVCPHHTHLLFLLFQTGLMWRQTGPIIISMTYMICDVLVFLFIFVIVYISFTLCAVYIYDVYDDNRTMFFNNHKSAFKLFWWTLIRTGNPHFPNIREFNSTLNFYNTSCIGNNLQVRSSLSIAYFYFYGIFTGRHS